MAHSQLIHRIEEAMERRQIVAVLSDSSKMVKSLSSMEYCAVLSALLRRLSPSFLSPLTHDEFASLFASVFISGSPIDSFLAVLQSHHLHTGFTTAFEMSQFCRLVDQLEEARMETLFHDSLEPSDYGKNCSSRSKAIPDDDHWLATIAELCQCLASLPDRFYNLQSTACESRIRQLIRNHDERLCRSCISTMEIAVERVAKAVDVDLRFVSALLFRCHGSSPQLLPSIFRWLSAHPACPIRDRICQRIFTDSHHGSRQLEKLIIAIVVKTPNVSCLERCFGDRILHNETLRNVLLGKLLMQRVFPRDEPVPELIAEYLAGSASRVQLMQETVIALIETWALPTAITHSTIEQHAFLSRCILRFAQAIPAERTAEIASQIQDKLIAALQNHLHSADVRIRQQGMFVTETLLTWFPLSTEENVLNFDYDESDEALRELREIVAAPPVAPVRDDRVEIANVPVSTMPTSMPDEEPLDSDDEFVPYAIPNEEQANHATNENDELCETRVTSPAYLRDCLEGLAEERSAPVFEAALFALERLIRGRAVGLADLAAQLLQALVFLNDRFHSNDFQAIRERCLVALLVQQPQLAPSTARLVFSPHCGFFHRHLLLDCLCAAARELSQPPPCPATESATVDEAELSRGKTRRFHKARGEARPGAGNRFASVCGDFFYPLLQFEGGPHLDLKGRDFAFLGRVLFAAGEILRCSANCPSTLRMARCLVDVLWPLRFHEEALVRGAVLFGYCSIAIAVSGSLLVAEFGGQLNHWIQWVGALVSEDSSKENREMAITTINLFRAALDETKRESHSSLTS